jgi:predicted membrane protein
MDESSIMLWSVLFSGIGMGYFIYGKKQEAPIPLFTGLALFVFPYFMPNFTLLLAVGLALVALPYFIKI